MGIMLAAFVGNGDYDCSPPNTRVYQNQVTDLMDIGYIMSNAAPPPHYKWKLTDKGRAWLDAALSTPEPIKETRWIMQK